MAEIRKAAERDVLPVAALGEIEFRPACAEETDCTLTYRDTGTYN